mmetsp:Transcript_6419/g.18641  ORF Transcript_6419/g.18641 Transcript_6419/m.18641 type:complete len:246 (-) Transcript_6419:238-975(-)
MPHQRPCRRAVGQGHHDSARIGERRGEEGGAQDLQLLGEGEGGQPEGEERQREGDIADANLEDHRGAVLCRLAGQQAGEPRAGREDEEGEADGGDQGDAGEEDGPRALQARTRRVWPCEEVRQDGDGEDGEHGHVQPPPPPPLLLVGRGADGGEQADAPRGEHAEAERIDCGGERGGELPVRDVHDLAGVEGQRIDHEEAERDEHHGHAELGGGQARIQVCISPGEDGDHVGHRAARQQRDREHA